MGPESMVPFLSLSIHAPRPQLGVPRWLEPARPPSYNGDEEAPKAVCQSGPMGRIANPLGLSRRGFESHRGLFFAGF